MITVLNLPYQTIIVQRTLSIDNIWESYPQLYESIFATGRLDKEILSWFLLQPDEISQLKETQIVPGHNMKVRKVIKKTDPPKNPQSQNIKMSFLIIRIMFVDKLQYHSRRHLGQTMHSTSGNCLLESFGQKHYLMASN